MHVDTAFEFPALQVALLIGLLGGLLCVLWPESVRAFAARYHAETAALFSDAEAHRRFIRFCGWALLALAAGPSIAALMTKL